MGKKRKQKSKLIETFFLLHSNRQKERKVFISIKSKAKYLIGFHLSPDLHKSQQLPKG